MWDKILIFFVVGALCKKISTSEYNKFVFHFKFFIYYFYCCAVSSVLWPFFLLRPKNVKNSKFAASLLKLVTKFYPITWELRNGHILAEERGAVVVSNHQSSLDILGMFNIWEIADKVAAIARKEIFYVWPFGLAAYLAGVVFIDRKNGKEAYSQMKKTTDVMVKDKTKIWIFPEGTRNKTGSGMLPFKKGAFNIAIAAQVPIIPVVYSPYYFIDRRKHIFSKGHVIIHCLEPIPTKGLEMEDVPDLINRVRAAMEKSFIELSEEVLGHLTSENSLYMKNKIR